ncbi:MAG: hypothetical protein H6707_10205 [Deltaproteobacteria bacterium]|nr:hypothetical protein [Deltaproteobacteria bacterium]
MLGKLRVFSVLIVSVALGACEAGTVGISDCDGGPCGGGDAGLQVDQYVPKANPNDCKNDRDCSHPYVCHTTTHRCVPPSAKNNGLCSLIEGTGCDDPNHECIDGVCQPPPGKCDWNEDCPGALICKDHQCAPDDKIPGDGCVVKADCTTPGTICVGGQCIPEGDCKVPHNDNRLAGAWTFSSTLKIRDGLKGFTKGLLGFAKFANDLITGRFEIKGDGVTSIVVSELGRFAGNEARKYLPSWATELVAWLAALNDVLDEWKIVSTETLTRVGPDQYIGVSKWSQIEFDYLGQQVVTDPKNLPGLGQLASLPYSAREVCGTFFIDPMRINSSVGNIWRWALEAAMTAITCTNKKINCQTNLNSALSGLIDCAGLGLSASNSNNNLVNRFAGTLEAGCQVAKDALITGLIKELSDASVTMKYMTLRGKADISNDSQLTAGRWYGTLGGTFGGGNFEGDFSAFRQ